MNKAEISKDRVMLVFNSSSVNFPESLSSQTQPARRNHGSSQRRRIEMDNPHLLLQPLIYYTSAVAISLITPSIKCFRISTASGSERRMRQWPLATARCTDSPPYEIT